MTQTTPLSLASDDSLAEALTTAASHGSKEIAFIEGDLLARPDLPRLLSILTQHDLAFRCRSAAYQLADRSRLTALQTAGLTHLDLDLPAGSPYAHLLMTGREDFAENLTGIANVCAAGVPCTVILPVEARNHGTLNRAIAWLDTLPDPPKVRFEPALPTVFEADIARAHAEQSRWREAAIDSEPARHFYRATGRRLHFDPTRCPFRSGEPLLPDGRRHALLQVNEGEYELYELDAVDVTSDSAMIARSLRGRLLAGSPLRPTRLSDTCQKCPRLHNCPGAFRLGEPSDPASLAAPLPQKNPASSDERPIELSLLARSGPNAWRALRAALIACPVGDSIVISGDWPIGVCLPPAESPEASSRPSASLAAIGPALIADMARRFGHDVVDYQLPDFGSVDGWQLVCRRVSENSAFPQHERTAVACISSACVAQCLMCALPQAYAGYAIPTPQVWRLLEELKLTGFSAVDLFGGEITLRDDLATIVRLSKSLALYTMVITTGYGLDDDAIATLVDAGLDKLEVALDAPDAPLHDRIKGRPGLFVHALRAIRAAVRHPRLYVEVNTVILADNLHELPRLHRFVADELGLRRHRFFYYVHIPSGLSAPRWLGEKGARAWVDHTHDELINTSREFNTILDFCPPIDPSAYADQRQAIDRLATGAYQESTPCHAPERDLMIMPDGEVYACMSPTIVKRRPVLGLLGETRLIDALRSPARDTWLSEAGTWPECRGCIAKRG